MTPDQLAKLYRVPLTDFGEHDRRGLLISSGAGIMSSVMDQVPFRYCVDTDELRGRMDWLESFVAAMHSLDSRVAICGWFSYSDPEPLTRLALACRPDEIPVYFGGGLTPVPWASSDLASFLTACRARNS